jgi:hypothetical protein
MRGEMSLPLVLEGIIMLVTGVPSAPAATCADAE